MSRERKDDAAGPSLAHIETGRGWSIVHHRLFHVPPESASEVKVDLKGFTVWDLYFLQDLVLIENHAKALLLDVGWYPHADPLGAFRLLLVRRLSGGHTKENLASPYDWDSPIIDFETRSIEELLSRIHEIVMSD